MVFRNFSAFYPEVIDKQTVAVPTSDNATSDSLDRFTNWLVALGYSSSVDQSHWHRCRIHGKESSAGVFHFRRSEYDCYHCLNERFKAILESLARFSAAKADLQKQALAEALEYEDGLHNHHCSGCRRQLVSRCDCLHPLVADWCSAECYRVSEL